MKTSKIKNFIKDGLTDEKIKEIPFKNSAINAKSKKTCMEHFGVEYSFQSENNKEKSKQAWIEKYGVDNPLKSDIVFKLITFIIIYNFYK